MSLLDAKRTTFAEFSLHETAYRIKQENIERNMAMQAWMNQTVQATKGKGRNARSAYKAFDDFYNSKECFEAIFNPPKPKKKKRLSLADRNRLLNQKRGGN